MTSLLATLLAAACVQPGPPARGGTFGSPRAGVLAAVDGTEATAVSAAAGTAAGTAPGQPLPTTPAAQPAAAAGDPARADERALRNELATAEDPTDAACLLAGHLAASERHREAVFVVDTARQRADNVRLRVARAELLRDLARRGEAIRELEAARRDFGDRALLPETLRDLAELHWLEGGRDAAGVVLRELDTVHAGDPWLSDNRAELDELAAEIDHAERPERAHRRDLLANLRGAPTATLRLSILNGLAARGAAGRGDDLRELLRREAIAIACCDDSPSVRARAVQLAASDDVLDETFWRAALADPAPLVRRFAAAGAADRYGRAATPLLLDRLAAEADPDAFRALHDALLRVAAPANAPSRVDATTAAGRAAAVAFWRAACGR